MESKPEPSTTSSTPGTTLPQLEPQRASLEPKLAAPVVSSRRKTAAGVAAVPMKKGLIEILHDSLACRMAVAIAVGGCLAIQMTPKTMTEKLRDEIDSTDRQELIQDAKKVMDEIMNGSGPER